MRFMRECVSSMTASSLKHGTTIDNNSCDCCSKRYPGRLESGEYRVGAPGSVSAQRRTQIDPAARAFPDSAAPYAVVMPRVRGPARHCTDSQCASRVDLLCSSASL